jgi:hypothetical protein
MTGNVNRLQGAAEQWPFFIVTAGDQRLAAMQAA